jgi:hypothetical protein
VKVNFSAGIAFQLCFKIDVLFDKLSFHVPRQIVDHQLVTKGQGYLEHIQAIRCLIIDITAKFDEAFKHFQSFCVIRGAPGGTTSSVKRDVAGDFSLSRVYNNVVNIEVGFDIRYDTVTLTLDNPRPNPK